MAPPIKYIRVSSFTAYEATNPTSPKPGATLDQEFNAIKVTTDQTIDRLALIQRADGKIANGAIDRLSLAGQIVMGVDAPQSWAPFTNYTVRNSVIINNSWFWCIASHTSTDTFSIDLANGLWQLIANFSFAGGGTTLPDPASAPMSFLGISDDGSVYLPFSYSQARQKLLLPAGFGGQVAYLRNDGTGTIFEAGPAIVRADLLLPDPATGSTLGDYLQLKLDKSGYRYRTPAQVFADLGLPTFGTAASKDVGTTALKVVQLDNAGKLPAVDGSQLTNLPTAALSGLTGLFGGFTAANNGVSSIDFTRGAATADDFTTLMASTGTITKSTSAWAVGSGNGGLDTGTIAANTWYHSWVIKRTDTGVVDVLLSLSATAPTMPANYTKKRRIIGGSFKTNGSSQWLSFTQYGSGSRRKMQWPTRVLDVSGQTLPTANRTLYTFGSTPPGIKVDAEIVVRLTSSGGGVSQPLTITSPDETDNTVLSEVSGGDAAHTLYQAARLVVRTNTSQQIGARGGSADVFDAATIGWYDDL